MPATLFEFAPFRLDVAQGVLLRGAERVSLVPKAVELLALLVQEAGRVVARGKLVESLWPDVIVEEGNLTKLVFQLRQELGDDAIETVPKRGYRFTRQVAAALPEEALAVLPFVDMSEGRTEGSFCEGLSEEILNAVSRIPGIKVVSRTSSFRFGGSALDVKEVARVLSATLLVEGSIRRSGQNLRISARLVDCASGYQRWSDTFDREPVDVFAVQREIARAVAKSLQRDLPEAEDPGARAVGFEAYELYLHGRYYWNRRPGEVVWQALRCFEQAVEKEPRFAAAWAGIADIYATLGSWENGVLEPDDAHSKARRFAARALEIDPELPEAHTTLGYTALHHEVELERSEECFRHALTLNPSYAPAHHWYSHTLVAAGRFEESMVESRLALECDPMNLLLSVHLAWHHHMTREPALTLEQAGRVVALDAGYHWGHYFVGWGCEALSEMDRAVEAMREAVRWSGNNSVMVAGLARAYAAAGDRPRALATVEELERERAGRALLGYELALVHLALGEREAALRELERAQQDRSGWRAYLSRDPRLDPLRSEPRFAALLAGQPGRSSFDSRR